MEKLLLKYI